MKKLIAALLALTLTTLCAAAFASGGELPTLTAGKLTIGTGQPAWEPWVLNDDPESGEGFESALAYAVAERLGFAKEDVVWVRTQFEEAIQPGPKSFDFNLQQYSVTQERKVAVDFSTVYYKEPLAVVVKADGPFTQAASIADLKDAVFGAASGDIAVSFTQDNIQPAQPVQVFNDLAAVAQALNAGQIDAMVAGVTTADYLTFDQVENGMVLGILAGSEDVTDGLALVLDKDSPMTAAVSEAVDSLLADGSIDALKAQWLGQYDVPVLE
ncbi:MAG: ABC transporter substrate-binding protein, partial [Oscillospiraceae bacterium]|jgi:polar amino acid transport system substrate-binding protein|nr:ABC transporter substrate-binding protein [Oscillospiraceae bacterium]